jgi:hypothetical protein
MSQISLSPAATGTANFTIAAPATNNNRTITLPDSSGQVSVLDLRTAVNSTSGTSVDFLNIPATARRITVMFNGVSTNGTSPMQVQLGDSGGIENTGYACAIAFTGPATGLGTGSTSGFPVSNNAAASTMTGHLIATLVESNSWVYSSALVRTNDGYAFTSGGSKTLSGTLDRVRITTVNGTDTFDAGTINIMVE